MYDPETNLTICVLKHAVDTPGLLVNVRTQPAVSYGKTFRQGDVLREVFFELVSIASNFTGTGPVEEQSFLFFLCSWFTVLVMFWYFYKLHEPTDSTDPFCKLCVWMLVASLSYNQGGYSAWFSILFTIVILRLSFSNVQIFFINFEKLLIHFVRSTHYASMFITFTTCFFGVNRMKSMSRKDCLETFSTVDGNYVRNMGILKRFFRSDIHVFSTHFYGYTLYNGERFPFPVYCDAQTFHRFYVLYKDLPNDIKRDMMLREDYRYPLRIIMKPLFQRRLSFGVYDQFYEASKFINYPIMFLSLTSVIWCGWSYFFYYLLFALIMYVFVLSFRGAFHPVSVFYVIGEELMNDYFGIWNIIFLETSFQTNWAVVRTLVIGHILLSYIPLHWRVPIHLALNVFHSDKMGYTFSVDRTMVELVSALLDIIRKAVAKDVPGIALTLGQHHSYIQELFDFQVTLDDVAVDLGESLGTFTEDAKTGNLTESSITLVSDLHEGHILLRWLPKEVRASKTFKASLACIMFLVSTRFFRDKLAVTAVGSYVISDDFRSSADAVGMIGAALSACYNAATRFSTHGTWESLWDMPPDVYFNVRGNEILARAKTSRPSRDVIQDIADANNLIMSRLYLKNDNAAQRLIDALRKFVDSQERFLRNQALRDQPIVIWLNGPPGTGKTTLLTAICDYLAIRDNVPRVPGDILDLKLKDKYPGSTGAEDHARYVFMNDIENDFSEYAKSDLIPLCLMLQMIVDTFPFSLRAAAVEDKGKVLSKIKYVFLTSNHLNFKMGGETEKLERRLDYGVLVNVDVRDKQGKPMKYKEFSSLPAPERNDAWKFTLLDVACKEKFVTFSTTDVRYGFGEFISYLDRRISDWEVKCANTKESFSKAENRCACGIAVQMHLTSVRGSEKFLDGSKHYKCLSKQCEEFICENHEKFDVGTWHLFSVDWTFIIFMGIIINLFMPLWKFLFWEACRRTLTDLINKKADSIVLHSWTYDFVEQNCHPRTFHAFRMRRALALVRKFIKDYGNYIAGGIALWGLSKMLRRSGESELAMAPIFSKDVDPKSMSFLSYRNEVNYPAGQLRNWKKEPQEMKVVEFNKKGVAGDDLEKLSSSNVLDVKLKWDENGSVKYLLTRLLALTPEIMIFNKHYFRGVTQDKNPRFELDGIEYPISITALLSTSDVEMYGYFHRFPRLFRGIHSYLAETVPYAILEVKCVEDGSDWVVAQPEFYEFEGKYRSFRFPREGKKGDCCTPVIGRVDGGSFLVGVVAYITNGSPYTGAAVLDRDWFRRLLDGYQYPIVEDIRLSVGSPITDLSMMSEGRNKPLNYMFPIGTDPRVGYSFHSCLRKTKVHDLIVPCVKKTFGIPKRDQVMEDGVFKSAFTNTFNNFDLPCNITQYEEDKVVEMMMKKFDDPRFDGVKLSFLDLESAIFGNEALGIDRINFKTSCGFEMKNLGIRDKTDLFVPALDENYRLMFRNDVAELLDHFDKTISLNIAEVVFVDGVLKDEIREQAKLDSGKIRIFTVLSVIRNLWGRMALMPLITLLLRNPDLFECYGGMNAGSGEWNRLAARLRQHPLYFDIDFSSFDASHATQAIRMTAKFMYRALIRFGTSEADAAKVYTFVTSLRWQLFRYRNDLYMKFKGMPSGIIITLILNSLVNSFLIRIAFSRKYGWERTEEDFDANFASATVGDDDVSSVSEKYRDFIYGIVEEYRSMGYVITPANKLGRDIKYIPFSQLVFVKRRFLWDSVLGYVAPLEKDSIYKAFMFESKQCGVSPVQRLHDLAVSQQREMFLHGREDFVEFQTFLRKVFSQCQLGEFELLDYDNLVTEYKDHKFKTFSC